MSVGTGSYVIPGLAAGRLGDADVRHRARAGTFVATADALAQIGESNETNNTANYTADCIP